MKHLVRFLTISGSLFLLVAFIFMERLIYGIGSADVNGMQTFVFFGIGIIQLSFRYINFDRYDWNGDKK